MGFRGVSGLGCLVLSREWGSCKGSFKGFYNKGSIRGLRVSIGPVWFLVGNGGLDYGDYYWGLCRDYSLGIHSPIPY